MSDTPSKTSRDADDLVDLDIVATELKVKRDHARMLCVNGKLPFVNVGTTDSRVIYRVRWQTLQDFKRREQMKAIDRVAGEIREAQSYLRLAESGRW